MQAGKAKPVAAVVTGATHSISRNASKTKPAKLLAVFVVDTNDNL